MLRLRFLSAIVGVPILLALAIVGGVPYLAAVAIAAILASFELYRMLGSAGYRPFTPLGIALAVGSVLAAYSDDARTVPALVAAALIFGLLWAMLRHDHAGAMLDWALTLVGALYVGGILRYFVSLRQFPDGLGLVWVLVVLLCTWACDITAFFVGRRWGRARLAPRISPGKSREGAAAALVVTVLVAVFAAPALTWLVHPETGGPNFARSPLHLAGLGLTIGICAIVGDLMESFIKRQCGAKDSGALIPGHGGVLDRMDSVLVAVAGAYFYLVATS
ncbi:MAG: phosphatidate cytidylyltransferase [Chloroflexi bacterium]|nr:phosphatidate cytidylyltransferase [Chloroflexota bacterium]